MAETTVSRLIIAHPDADYAALVGRHFQQQGWLVQHADSVGDVRRLARSSALLIISTEFPGETGWLTCAKLMQQAPFLKVILVADQSTADACRFADFVGGAALVEKRAGIRGLVEAVHRLTRLPAAG